MAQAGTAPLRFGLIGYGAFGRLHARCIERVDGAELVAICARSDAAAAQAAVDFPAATLHRDHRALVADGEVEVVDVVTPNHSHAEIGVAALEAGKDLLLEKPMATTVEDCDRLLAAAAGHKKLISVGFELRLSSQWGAIKRLIEDGAIGTPAYANLSLFRHPYRPGAGGWRHDRARVGSWILEEPVHFYDLVMWYFAGVGEPTSVRAVGNGARGQAVAGGAGMYDDFSSTLTFPGGRYATITQTLAGFEHHLVLELTGDQGALRSVWSGGDARSTAPAFEVKLLRAGAETPEILDLGVSGEVFELEEEIRQTVAAFRSRRALVSGAEARRSVLVCLAAERSVQTGEAIALDFRPSKGG